LIYLKVKFLKLKFMQQVSAFSDIVEIIASTSPQRIVDYKPSKETIERVQYLLIKKSEGVLNQREELELNQFAYLENMIGLAKARAYQILKPL
jgi:hypothetical protein